MRVAHRRKSAEGARAIIFSQRNFGEERESAEGVRAIFFSHRNFEKRRKLMQYTFKRRNIKCARELKFSFEQIIFKISANRDVLNVIRNLHTCLLVHLCSVCVTVHCKRTYVYEIV